MPFPSHGCKTCKQRRVKCDETQPICNRCKKGKLTCLSGAKDKGLIFLSENDYVVGTRKRPRGPNTKPRPTPEERKFESSFSIHSTPSPTSTTSIASTSVIPHSPKSPISISIPPSLTESLSSRALAYFTHNHILSPPHLPDPARSHTLHIPITYSSSSSFPNVLQTAVRAVAYATFARAHHAPPALVTAHTHYARAIQHVSRSMTQSSTAPSQNDDLLLAVMLLSFYENAVLDRQSDGFAPTSPLPSFAERSFAHHDGAMAMMRVRREKGDGVQKRELDRLVRRQLVRSVLLRRIAVPMWLRDGAAYGEEGVALELDRCMVIVAKLAEEGRVLQEGCEGWIGDKIGVARLLEEAQKMDRALDGWVEKLKLEDGYASSTHGVEDAEGVFDGTVHVYSTAGHAGLWNRYRALRLLVNDIILITLGILDNMGTSTSLNDDTEIDAAMASNQTELATRTIEHLATDLCSSIPYLLQTIERNPENTNMIATKAAYLGNSNAISASIGSLLAWPLAISSSIAAIPLLHRQYLRARLMEVSKIVDDGVLERLAENYCAV